MSQDRDDDIRKVVGGGHDFESMAAVLNVYRAATSIRNQIERKLLNRHGLSWGGFTALFVLWIWGPMESHRLAHECGLAKGTLSGVLTTLERRDLIRRNRLSSDRRRVEVVATGDGLRLVKSVYPEFNRLETDVTSSLTGEEKRLLADMLGRLRVTAEGIG